MSDMNKLTDEKHFKKSYGMTGRGTPGKPKEEGNGQDSGIKQRTTFRSRPQTPNHALHKQIQPQGKQKLSHEETDSKMISGHLKQTPGIEKPQRSNRCDSLGNTPVSHSYPLPCKRILRLSCETPPSTRNVKNVEYSGATPINILNRDEIPQSCTDTPECYSNVNLGTPSQRFHCGDFQDLLGEETSNLTVGIRVRPLSYREKSVPSVTSVVNVVGNEVKVTCDTGILHRFFYDHCFWSSDSSHPEYADQETVFSIMAQPLLDKVLNGYNACLFAYGQTGSGKSYSMMGLETDGEKEFGKEAGIIPRFCHALFKLIESGNDDGKKASSSGNVAVEISYFEIYNEKIHDLLGSSSDRERRTPLKVREHPVLGPYVVDLSEHVVVSYEDLKGWLMVGNSQKATASTVMNEKSSRSHSIFCITLTQRQKDVLNGEIYEHSRRSKINLVDLAGSERVSQTCATGERLREGVSINRSLLTLGKVIASLAENTSNKKRHFIPYRESILTWLLKESLGGNSRTAMLATISPASVHAEETLATLRYACQARTIVNRVRINEEPRDRVIRHLREEVERLRTSRGDCEHQRHMSMPLSPLDDKQCLEDDTCEISQKEELKKLKEQLLLSKEEFAETQRRWSERLEQAENIKKVELTYLRRCGIALKLDIEKQACLINLTPDPVLSGTLIYLIPPGRVNIGREDQIDSNTDIALSGPLIKDSHCTIENKAEGLTLIPGNGPCFINGVEVTEEHSLHHGDRLVIGGNHYFRVNNPEDPDASEKGGEPADYCFAHEEIRTVQENRLKTELEEAKKRALIQLEEAEKKLSSQRSTYEMQIQELGKSLQEHIEALAEVQKEKDNLSIKNCVLEEKAKSVERNITNHSILDCSVDIPVTPYRSNLVEEVMKVLNESTDDPEFLMPTDSFSLHDIKIMCLEAEERCKETGINFEFYHQHIVKDHRLIPVIKVYDTECDVVAVWEPDFFADWLHQLRVHEPGENIALLKRGNGSWEKSDEFPPEDQSSHLLSLSMSEIKRQLDDTLTGTESNDSASTLFNQTSLSINNTLLEESEAGSSNYDVFEDVSNNLQQIDQAVSNLKQLFRDTVNKDVEENVNVLSNTVAKLKSLLMISDGENFWQDSSMSNTVIKVENQLEKIDTSISPSETWRTERKYDRHHHVRVKKSVRFIFTDSQQQIEDS
ncbi:kinesin-like protein KIF14 [Schistocerca cancellata]|uniref:kinesin-like protein KIF14 n=1 Tax=Schistocerca cancellata TaxID=274614 RepID=UPI0021181DBE|nr:kinesin-like protein KIF14 [Schistocerca cancellata]